MLTTTQQVAGAAGTAALVSTMSAVAVADIAAGATETAALANGIGTAFMVAAALATLGIVLALMVPNVKSDPGDGSAPSH